MLDIKIKKLTKTAQIPVKGHQTDACFDVFADRIEKLDADFCVVYLGFALEIPEGWKAVCVPRSSLTKTKWLVQNSPGQIDSDYRGELQFRFRAIPNSPDCDSYYSNFPFNVGDRVGQMYFEPVHQVTFIESDNLTETKRNEGGFGSTGK